MTHIIQSRKTQMEETSSNEVEPQFSPESYITPPSSPKPKIKQKLMQYKLYKMEHNESHNPQGKITPTPFALNAFKSN